MKKLFSVFMTLCMFLSVCSVMAFAAPPKDEEIKDPGVIADVLGAMDNVYVGANIKLYVKANKSAGLPTKVKVNFNLSDLGGAVFLPGNAKAKGLCFSWNDPDLTLTKDGVTYKSGEAPIAPVGETYVYQANNKEVATLLSIRTCKGSSGVDAMFLDIDESKGSIKAMNSDPDHETECFGKVVMGDIDRYISIKGRGNSTWEFPKKPYNITFYKDGKYDNKKKAELIKGTNVKKWTLTANFFDNSLLRNKLAMDLAKDMGIGLDSKFVDVWMNGKYLGNYLLTAKKDHYCADEGYVVENDHIPLDAEEQFTLPGMHDMPAKHNRMNISEIGDIAKANGEDLNSVKKHMVKAWKTILDYDSETYQEYWDIESWAKMFLMFEVSKTYDCYAGNILMHRDGTSQKDKIIAGPAWDYDVAFGRTLHKFLVWVSIPMQMNAEGWYNEAIGEQFVDQPVSILQALGRHESFMKEVERVYKEYEWAFKDLAKNVDRQKAVVKDSALMNNVRWGTNHLGAVYLVAPNTMSALGTGKYKLNYEITLTWDNYVNNLREYCNKRVLWLSDNL